VTDAVTVVVPTRNRRPVLATTLQAILDQRDVDVHVVVVDEASSDDTPAFLASLDDARVSIVRHDEPKGVAAARNAGLGRATTAWVAFCDDDDLWSPDKLRAQLDAIAAFDGARWSCTGCVSIDDDLHVIGFHRPPASGDISELMRATNVVPAGGSSLLAETALVREVGGYDAWPTGCEDFELHCRLAAAAPVATVDRPLVGYRVSAGAMSTNVAKMRTGHQRTVERHRGTIPRPLARAADLHAEQYWARFHLRNRDRLAAARAYTGIAVRYRRPGQLAYAVTGVLAPRWADRHQAALERAAVPAAWEAQARAWLDLVAVAEPTTV